MPSCPSSQVGGVEISLATVVLKFVLVKYALMRPSPGGDGVYTD